MRVIIFLIITIFNCALLQATGLSLGDKVPGYVILNNKQKVEGKIIIGSIIQNEISIGFIRNGNSKKIIFTPKEIRSYAYQKVEINDLGQKVTSWVHYDRQKANTPPRPLDDTSVFMLREAEGIYNLYAYFIEVRGAKNDTYQYSYYLADEKGIVRPIQKEAFQQTCRQIFKDYTALVHKIGNGEFEFRNLDQIVRDYNFWMVNQHDKNQYRMVLKNDEIMDDMDFDSKF